MTSTEDGPTRGFGFSSVPYDEALQMRSTSPRSSFFSVAEISDLKGIETIEDGLIVVIPGEDIAAVSYGGHDNLQASLAI